METQVWTPDMALGIPLFDEAHQALAAQIEQLQDGPDDDVEDGLALLIDCLEADFRVEEALMEAIDYPSLRSHREQHARVLAGLRGLPGGDLAACRHAVGLVLPWFKVHLATSDTSLAIALQVAGLNHAPAHA
jgi:hemerythrin-like metal-binding protein